jgi:2-amino-4-hydroxy-6-hydroxymethyldihydropteridine diphosphokinase
MSVVYVLLGTNLGNKSENINQAKIFIRELNLTILKESGVYKSSPWGFDHPESFYNQVICLQTELSPDQLLIELLNIEKQMGRFRTAERYEARIIDLDILFYDNRIVQSEKLSIPHPLLHQRRFTLEPLCEIAASLVHPVLKKSIYNLLNECEDSGIVKLI